MGAQVFTEDLSPVVQPPLQLREEELCVELVDGGDVGEDEPDHILGEGLAGTGLPQQLLEEHLQPRPPVTRSMAEMSPPTPPRTPAQAETGTAWGLSGPFCALGDAFTSSASHHP